MNTQYEVEVHSYEQYQKKFNTIPYFNTSQPVQVFSNMDKAQRTTQIHILDTNDELVNTYFTQLSKQLSQGYFASKKITKSCLNKAVVSSLERCIENETPALKLLKLARIQKTLQNIYPSYYVEEHFNRFQKRLKVPNLVTFSKDDNHKKNNREVSTPSELNPNLKFHLNS